MSRKEFIDKLPAEQKKQLEELKKHNSEAMKANEVIKNLNADLRIVTQDIKDADGAHATAVQALGATASKADIEAKESGDQDREVHRSRNPDAQGHRAPSRMLPFCGLRWARRRSA